MKILSLRNRLDRKAKRLLNKYLLKPLGATPLPPRVPLYFIELTNKCNLRCPMCPRSDAAEGRGLGFMDFDLYRYIIDRISEYGARYVNLNRFGESLLYPKFIEAVAYAKAKDIPNIGVVTNATLLTREMAEAIVDVGLDRIRFSLDSLDPVEYANGRVGAELDDVLQKIDYFFAYKKKKGAEKPVAGINSVLLHDNYEQLKKIYERFKGVCEVHFKPMAHYGVTQNWDKIKEYANYRRRPCIQPWERMNFFYNGDVNVCCGDVEGELIIGNIKEKSIKELWFGERAREIRSLHMALDFEKLRVCQVCSGINADWYEDSLRQQREIYERLDPQKKVVGLSNTAPKVE